MPRHKFPGDLHLQANGTPAVGAPFTFWSSEQSGFQYTDILAQDGVTTATLVTDGSGNRPYLFGPDNIEVMYVDTGASIRYPVYAIDVLSTTLDESFVAGIDAKIAAAGGSGGGTGGLPAGTTLDQIPNGADRLAMTLTERNKLAGVENNANRLLLGTTAGTAMVGNRTFTAAEVGAVRSMSGGVREWFRTAAQGFPTAAEGALDGDWLIMDDA